jgi:hypothetical protein
MTIKKSRAELFGYLGAPLNNVQWSWGALREIDGAVFLVVWQDENLRRENRHYSLVHNQTYWGDSTDSPGLNERRRHLELVRQGSKAYLIMARAERPGTAGARRIRDLNVDEVFVGGEVYEDEAGNLWLERVRRIPLGDVRLPRPPAG